MPRLVRSMSTSIAKPCYQNRAKVDLKLTRKFNFVNIEGALFKSSSLQRNTPVCHRQIFKRVSNALRVVFCIKAVQHCEVLHYTTDSHYIQPPHMLTGQSLWVKILQIYNSYQLRVPCIKVDLIISFNTRVFTITELQGPR